MSDAPRSGITWLASYPKSGNTWTRAFLTAYLVGEIRLNQMIGVPTVGSRLLIDRWLGFPTLGMAHHEVENLRPMAYRRLGQACIRRGRPAILKVHDTWHLAPDGSPIFPPDVTFRAVYLVRDPRDVCCSFAHHLGKDHAHTAAMMAREDFSLAVHAKDAENQVWQLMGSWTGNIASWIDDSDLLIHLMRYEDMKRDPAKEFRRLLQYMDIPVDEIRLGDAIAKAHFSQLRQKEGVVGFREIAKTADTPFFRKGAAGGWKDELPPEVRARIEFSHGAMMKRLGYL